MSAVSVRKSVCHAGLFDAAFVKSLLPLVSLIQISWVSTVLVSGWVAVFSPNDVPRLIKPKKVKFGTGGVYSMRMALALRFLEKVFNCGKMAFLA